MSARLVNMDTGELLPSGNSHGCCEANYVRRAVLVKMLFANRVRRLSQAELLREAGYETRNASPSGLRALAAWRALGLLHEERRPNPRGGPPDRVVWLDREDMP